MVIQQMAKPSPSLIVNSSMSGMVRKMNNSPCTRGVHFATTVLLMRQKRHLNACPKIFLTDFVDRKAFEKISLLSEIYGPFISYQQGGLNYMGMAVFLSKFIVSDEDNEN
jgi:hypothetical protein